MKYPIACIFIDFISTYIIFLVWIGFLSSISTTILINPRTQVEANCKWLMTLKALYWLKAKVALCNQKCQLMVSSVLCHVPYWYNVLIWVYGYKMLFLKLGNCTSDMIRFSQWLWKKMTSQAIGHEDMGHGTCIVTL